MATQVEDIKWLPSATDRRFMVDGFAFKNSACKTYFLTHFHSDHTIGLVRNFSGWGTIYTSEVTAALLIHDMRVDPRCVRALPMHTPFEIEGCRVTLVDAHHCPGAVMLVVEVLQGRASNGPRVILHTGDMRWADWMLPHVQGAARGLHVDTVFLDTTYCQPRYTFPPQEEVLAALSARCRQALSEEPDTLLVVAAYHTGKERVFFSVARALGLKVWCSQAKLGTLRLLGLPPEDLECLTQDPASAQLHVTSWGLKPEALRARYLEDQEQYVAQGQYQLGAGLDASPGAVQLQGSACAPLKVEEPSGIAAGVLVKAEEGEDAEEERSAARAAAGRWKRVIGIRATGWTFRKRGPLVSEWKAGDEVMLLGAPYSEHSSWAELCSCVGSLRPRRIVPTVNASTPSQSRAIVDRFAHLMDLSRDRSRIDVYLTRGPSSLRLAPSKPPARTPPPCAPMPLIDLTQPSEGREEAAGAPGQGACMALGGGLSHSGSGLSSYTCAPRASSAGSTKGGLLPPGSSLQPDGGGAVIDLAAVAGLGEGEAEDDDEDEVIITRVVTGEQVTCLCAQRPRAASGGSQEGGEEQVLLTQGEQLAAGGQPPQQKHGVQPDALQLEVDSSDQLQPGPAEGVTSHPPQAEQCHDTQQAPVELQRLGDLSCAQLLPSAASVAPAQLPAEECPDQKLHFGRGCDDVIDLTLENDEEEQAPKIGRGVGGVHQAAGHTQARRAVKQSQQSIGRYLEARPTKRQRL